MKKIININLSGRVIPIEDSAYEKLQAYIESLRRHFSHEEGRDEIINDIESRIAELMNDRVRKGAACVTDADIDEIISSIGRPEDFDSDAAETETGSTGQQQQYSYAETRSRKRLYRDSSDKFIGGVCSGIAAYLNVDPAIVRILFAIITFGGFGLGFLAYILLWIILPEKDVESYAGKRLYRNPDDRVIGGVAGGLAAYFNSKASTIRLIFAAPIILSMLFGVLDGFTWGHDFDIFPNILFGSLSSTFILAYVILWIVLPEARTNYEKMEMRGEKVDLNSIRQNVQEGMGNVKDRMKTWGDEVKESAQNFSSKAKEFANTRGKSFAAEVSSTASTSGRGIGHAIGVLFKVFFLFIAGTIALALFGVVLALLFSGVAWWPINNFLWTSKWQQAYAWGTVIFFLAVPLIGFIVWIIRRIIGVRSRSGYLGWTFGFLWTLGWVSAIMLATSISRDFRREYRHKEADVAITQPVGGKMIVAVSEPELEYTGRFGWMNDDSEGWDLTDDTLKLSLVKFNIRASRDSSYHVFIDKYAHGRTTEEAMQRAQRINYTATTKDSILDLSNGFAVDKESKYRGQRIEIEIHVPVGKKIRFDRSVEDKLNPYNIKIKRSYRRGVVDIDVDDDYWHRFSAEVDYVMGLDGNLSEVNGSPAKTGVYRYEATDTQRIQDAIELKRRELKELEELKEKERSRPASKVDGNSDDNYDALAYAATPVFSLVKSF